jgi:hypothetical protein
MSMTGREIYEIWAPPESIWSPWVSPVLFASLNLPADFHRDAVNVNFPWHQQGADAREVILVDLPGAESIRLAMALAQRGYRPVPVINASPGPEVLSSISTPDSSVVLDMSALVQQVCEATAVLQSLELSPKAPPVFCVDSQRLEGTRPLEAESFDNRWMLFPQDFPSAKFLADQGVNRAILVQNDATQPQDDLAHTLLRWQEAGIEILAKSAKDSSPPIHVTVSRPSRFKASWYRALAILGFRRSSVGGFGSYIPETSAAG